ncbi:MAG: cellulose binding domain-containing protein [Bacteriovoracaceae bacterium]|nr:cellulose binding domain-containing protein [Bacteriovoracaceae bacterium]
MKTPFMAYIALVVLVGCLKSEDPQSIILSQTELEQQRIDMQAATLDECPFGGTTIRTYVDANEDFLLDEDEQILQTSSVCSGANGQDGQDGEDGADGVSGVDGVDGTNGTNGVDGVNGQDGFSPYGIVFNILTSAPSCPSGGITLTFALDVNRNNVLDAGDQQTTSAEICNGQDGEDGEDGEDNEPTPPAEVSCKVDVRQPSIWKDGYIVDVEMIYHGPNHVGWMASFSLPKNHVVVNSWNGAFSATSGSIAVSSYSYNQNLVDGISVSFGFQVQRPGNTEVFWDGDGFKLNGVTCTSI